MPRRIEKTKLTNAFITALTSGEKVQTDFWDADQPGFGIRVSSGGTKTFFVTARVNARLVRATVGKFPTMSADEARKRAKRLLIDMEDGKNPNDERKARRSGALTLGGVFETFIATRKDKVQELTERTEAHYKLVFKKHLGPWKPRHVGEITPAMCQDLHKQIGENRGTNVANQALRLLRRLMNFSRGRHGLPVVNPVSGIEWYADGRRSVIIKPADFPGWYQAVADLDNETARDYLRLVLFTGLRRNEAFGLTWENIDLEEKTLLVPDTKNGEPHSLPLSEFLHQLLKDRQARWGTTTGFVFPSWSGAGHLVNMQHTMNLLRDAGYPYTLHDLRRTFCTIAESIDISTFAVKRLMNHKQDDVTGRHYVVFDVERLRAPMEKISQELLRRATATRGKVIPMNQAA
jgi:integrase